MSKTLSLISAISVSLAAAGCITTNPKDDLMNNSSTAAKPPPVYRLDGSPDAAKGWTFKPAGKGKVYIPFEGYYESKGGRIQSPRIKLGKAPGQAGFYRLRFSARAAVPGFWWVDIFDRNGGMLPDINSSLYASETMRPYEEIIFADSRVDSVVIAFVNSKGVSVRDIVLEPVSVQEAAAWCDRLIAEITSKKYVAPSDAFARLPKTRDALLKGRPWRIVMLGDSMVNDTWNSNFQALVMRDFPSARLDFIISVRGSTGCWFYKEPENFKRYVADLKPDLVMIGGASNAPGKIRTDPKQDMVAVIRQCQGLGCEVLVMSPPPSWDWRKNPNRIEAWDESLSTPTGHLPLRRDYQRAVVKETGVAYWDLTVWPCDIRAESGKPRGWFNREDGGHNNDRGKQLIGQALAAWFRAAGK